MVETDLAFERSDVQATLTKYAAEIDVELAK